MPAFLMPLVATLCLTQAQYSQFPTFARGDWRKDPAQYSRMLEDIRPYYGERGFISVPVVRQKLRDSILIYNGDEGNPLKALKALTWVEVAYSDGNVFDGDKELAQLKREFIVRMQYWLKPVDSFTFVRTLAVVLFYAQSPDLFVENRLLEKLYVYRQTDTELELAYLIWSAMNSEVTPNKFTLQKSLEKQERLHFRKDARKRSLALCYSFSAAFEKKSPEFLEKSIELMNQWYASLPEGHFDKTKEMRITIKENALEKQKIADRWRRGW